MSKTNRLPPRQAKPSAGELAARRAALAATDAHNRIEGLYPDAETDPLFQAYVKGEISYDELGCKLHELAVKP